MSIPSGIHFPSFFRIAEYRIFGGMSLYVASGQESFYVVSREV